MKSRKAYKEKQKKWVFGLQNQCGKKLGGKCIKVQYNKVIVYLVLDQVFVYFLDILLFVPGVTGLITILS